jgi:hypothetical protein
MEIPPTGGEILIETLLLPLTAATTPNHGLEAVYDSENVSVAFSPRSGPRVMMEPATMPRDGSMIV